MQQGSSKDQPTKGPCENIQFCSVETFTKLLYLFAARGHPVTPVSGSPHSPMVEKCLAAQSDRMHHISIYTERKSTYMNNCTEILEMIRP